MKRAFSSCPHPRAGLLAPVNKSRCRSRTFTTTSIARAVKPFLLSDIGEGIREVQIIQWFVQPGARVEQFDKVCEVQSDKASVEITSRFDGVIKRLHYDADDMAEVGKPLFDIDVQGEIEVEDESLTTPPAEQAGDAQSRQQPQKAVEQATDTGNGMETETGQAESTPQKKSAIATLATPAVRHLLKQHGLDISHVEGSGKDGRVLKEDVLKHTTTQKPLATTPNDQMQPPAASVGEVQPDRTISLTPTQAAMFKTMTRSLSIPHFLYTDTVDVGPLDALRRILNGGSSTPQVKLTLLPFLIKALSIAMVRYPILNTRVDETSSDKPQLVIRGAHNIGIACDTPQGLVVPVIKAVQTLSLSSIALEASRLSGLAREGKLKANEMTGGTFTVSNIGSIGGGVVSPVIVEEQLGILGVGRSKLVPAFGNNGEIVRRQEVVLSWSADHRLVDGATVARAADRVKSLLEEPGRMLIELR